MPTKQLVIRRPFAFLLSVQQLHWESEMFGGIQDVRVEDITTIDTKSGVRIKTFVEKEVISKASIWVHGLECLGVDIALGVDLMGGVSKDSFVGDAKRPPSNNDIEMGMQLPRSNSDMGMDAFNKQIQDVEKQVDKVSGLLKNLKLWPRISSIYFN
ncbi:hypothetical protein GH714_033964 [Hevea brasiliensis]|uniref:Uncharacterized protein n=1 Tax=Hevea brasiliensis TaxID=3981 RepID=A0A6A6KA27_HEVBR|nr:hypothetical protein GH714_033964 [Hevea brasiliensis]